MEISVALVFAIVLLCVWKLSSKPKNFPPGPFRWPLLGSYVLFRTLGLRDTARTLALKYGEVSGLYLGSEPVIFVSSLEAFKEVSVREDLSGRPRSKNIFSPENARGLIFNQGDAWRDQRRFSLRHLRDLGFGKRSMESYIHEEINVMLNKLQRMAGPKYKTPVQLYEILGSSSFNILWYIMTGERYDHGDKQFEILSKFVKERLTNATAAGNFIQSFPWLAQIFPGLSGLNRRQQFFDVLANYLKEFIADHRKTLDVQHARDFIDVYLTEIEKQKGNPRSYFNESQLLAICKDLFVAGSDTTFNTITFCLVYMVKFPDEQRKVQEELDRVVGRDRLPSLEDRDRLVYTDAAVHEVMRMSTSGSLGVPHAPLWQTHDIIFRGYVIPKNARVLLNIGHIHNNRVLWGDPENFRPGRFLSADGTRVLRHEAFLSFGLGKRQCLGEALARNSVFLFFAAILQRFTLSVPPGASPPSLEPVGGFTVAPQPFLVSVTPRFIVN